MDLPRMEYMYKIIMPINIGYLRFHLIIWENIRFNIHIQGMRQLQ